MGGLSVLGDIRALLPYENLVYIADSAHVPYGEKSAGFIRERAMYLTQVLLTHRAKAIVIACNTATAAAAAQLRERFDVPIIAMEPAVKPAAAATKTGVVGVLATAGTSASAQYAALLGRFAKNIQVVTQACPGLPELVEAGKLDTAETRRLLTGYLEPLLTADADVIVLGCTHYPFLRPLISDLVENSVTLVDSGAAVARRLEYVLSEQQLLKPKGVATYSFWTSGKPHVKPHIQLVMSRLWGAEVELRLLSSA